MLMWGSSQYLLPLHVIVKTKHMHPLKQISLLVLSAISYSATAQEQSALVYNRNILSISPVQISENTPTGVGIQYERFLGADSKLSLYLPVAYSFGHSNPCDPDIRTRMLYAYPGVKFYPAGYKHKVTYAVGPSLAFGTGTTNCNCGELVTQTMELKPKEYKPKTEMGVLINNSVNVQATNHVYIGSEIGLGATYLNTVGGRNLGTDIMLQMNLKVGYRF